MGRMRGYRPIVGEPRILYVNSGIVGLSVDNNYISYNVAHLVARASLGPAPDGHGIRFTDVNRCNLHVSNLYNFRSNGVGRPGVVYKAWLEAVVYYRDRGNKREPKCYDPPDYPSK